MWLSRATWHTSTAQCNTILASGRHVIDPSIESDLVPPKCSLQIRRWPRGHATLASRFGLPCGKATHTAVVRDHGCVAGVQLGVPQHPGPGPQAGVVADAGGQGGRHRGRRHHGGLAAAALPGHQRRGAQRLLGKVVIEGSQAVRQGLLLLLPQRRMSACWSDYVSKLLVSAVTRLRKRNGSLRKPE